MFQPTGQQGELIDAINNFQDFTGVAYAGTGKTSTVVHALNTFPKSKKVLVIYFNRKAREEAQARLGHLPNVKVATNHTYAYAAVGSQYGKRVGGRVRAARVAEIMGIPQLELSQGPLTASAVASIAMHTVNKFTQTRAREIGPWHIPFNSFRAFDYDDQELIKSEIPMIAKQIWDDKCSLKGSLPLTHDDYLKMWADGNKSWFFGKSLIIVDEAQDSNDVLMGVILKHTKAQIGMIGDPYQNLYDWRGTVNGLDMLTEKRPDAVQCHLTKTHRFGGEVVEAANVWLSLLNAEYPLVGNDDIDSELVDYMTDADLVLNRTNAGVIGSAIVEAGNGRTFSIGGGTDQVKDLAEAASSLLAGKPTNHPDLIGFNTWPEVVKATEDDPSFSDLKVLVKLISDHGADKITEIADQARPEGNAEVHISTVHKIKGAEAKKVLIGSDFTGPEDNNGNLPNAGNLMTAYVAVTRAQNQLCEGSLSWGRDYLAEHSEDFSDFSEDALATV